MKSLGKFYQSNFAAGVLLFSTALWADTMHVADDAHIDLDNPGANVGGVPNLVVSNMTDRKTGERLTFVSYELTPLPAGASLEQAWLRLWVGRVETAGTVELYLADGAWDEETLNAGNAPGFSGPFMTAAVNDDDEGGYVLLDVTPEVSAWLDGSVDNHGFVIVPGAADVDVSFDSKENPQTSHGSELELVLGNASGGIDSEDIADNSIGTDDIEDGSIGSDDLADDSIMSGDIKDGTIGAADVDTSQLQRRVVGTCPPGSSIRVISESGGVSCEVDTDTNSGGDITAVLPGSFLDGGGTSGDVTLDIAPESIDESRIVNGSIGSSSINENDVQRRVNGTCPAGSSIREVRVNGSVVCEVDNDTTVDPGLFWQLGGNAGTSPIPGGANFLGTSDDTELALGVNGSPAFRLAYSNNGSVEAINVAGGHASNQVLRQGGTIAGGGYANLAAGTTSPNIVDARFGTIGGGSSNETRDAFSFIGGGGGNTIGAGGGGYATIVGGLVNTIEVDASEPTSKIWRSFIGGGERNQIIGGGFGVIVGGLENKLYSGRAFIGAGSNNSVCDPVVFPEESELVLAGVGDVIGGGINNRSCGLYSFIGSGVANFSSGVHSMVIGGRENEASGKSSLAAGERAIASHDGSFVWSDRSGSVGSVEFFSQRENQVRFQAVGGVRFDVGDDEGSWPDGNQWVDFRTQAANTHSDTALFRLIDTSTGAYLSLGGGWVNNSDINLKTDIRQVDGRDILDRLAGIPVQSWRYRVEDASIRHIGPMAQDFHAAFGFGGNPKGIMTVDADGVALAAIKALYEVTQELERRTEQLESQQLRLDALEAGLQALRASLGVQGDPQVVIASVDLTSR